MIFKRTLPDAKTQGEDSKSPIPYLHPSNESEGSSFGYGWRMETNLSGGGEGKKV